MNSHTETSKGDYTTGHGPEVGEPNTNKAANDTEETFQAFRKFLQDWQKADIIQALILLVGSIYCIVTIGLWCSARSANDLAERNFRRDERAWTSLRFIEGQLPLALDMPFTVPTEITNTGKTPAQHVRGNVVVSVFKKDEPLDFAYTPGHSNYIFETGVVFNGAQAKESYWAMKHEVPTKNERIILTRDLERQLFSGDMLLIVHGRVEYRDIFGTEHWSTYCHYVLHPELISQQCLEHNEVDNND